MIMASHIIHMLTAIEVNPVRYYMEIVYEYLLATNKTCTVDRVFSETLLKSTLSVVCDEIVPHNIGALKLTLNVSSFFQLI